MIIQIFLFILSASAMFLISRTESWKKWGFVLGLLSQPFWFMTTIPSKQWGLVALSCLYTFSWCQGIYLYFFKGKTKKEVWDDLKFWNDSSFWKEKNKIKNMKRIRNIVLSKNAEIVFNEILNDVVAKNAKIDNYDEEVINYALEALYAMEEMLQSKNMP